jgi:hypothetical protein
MVKLSSRFEIVKQIEENLVWSNWAVQLFPGWEAVTGTVRAKVFETGRALDHVFTVVGCGAFMAIVHFYFWH